MKLFENGVTEVDNRNEPPMNVTDEYYHPEYNTVSCPHCNGTLARHVVMSNGYCYVCGGKFGKVDLSCDYEKEGD